MNRTDDLRTALREAAHALTSLTPEMTALAEGAVLRALACARDIRSLSLSSLDWPSEELAVCRQLVLTANLFWEVRRLSPVTNAGESQSWIA